jgi:hypothetical protein
MRVRAPGVRTSSISRSDSRVSLLFVGTSLSGPTSLTKGTLTMILTYIKQGELNRSATAGTASAASSTSAGSRRALRPPWSASSTASTRPATASGGTLPFRINRAVEMRILFSLLVALALTSCARQDPLEQILRSASKNLDASQLSQNAVQFLGANEVAGLLPRADYPAFIWTVSTGVGRSPTAVTVRPKQMVQVDFGAGVYGIGLRIYAKDQASGDTSTRARQILWTDNMYFYSVP